MWALAVVGLAVHALQAKFNIFGHGADGIITNWVYDGLLLIGAALVFLRAAAMGPERLAWRLLGCALAVSALGDIIWAILYSSGGPEPYPSLADAAWLSSYPLSVAALALLLRARTRRLSRGALWIDAAIGSSAIAALAAALVFGPVLDLTGGTSAVVATNLAYPVGDLILLSIVAAMFALTGWRPDRGLAILGAALLLRISADGIYLIRTANGTYEAGGLLDTMFPLGSMIIAVAAWQTPRRVLRPVDDRMHSVFPALFTLTALGLLVYDHFKRIDVLALGLSTLTVVLAAGKITWMLRDTRRAHEHSSELALTDPLTGLANRRALMADLGRILEDGVRARPHVLGLLDLDGFKDYNDRFGHIAGDALLARLSLRLRAAIEPYGHAYRIGGDEFCVLIASDGENGKLGIAAAAAGLSEADEDFTIEPSHGAARLPAEATDVSAAMHLADTRMYAQKDSRVRAGTVAHTCNALIRAQHARLPGLDSHLERVAELAGAVGDRLGLTHEDGERLAWAARLHDLGQVAAPAEEGDPMRTSPLMGQRILGTERALRGIGQLIRSAEERFDGDGSPDGLRGERIPMGARVIAVCDAFDVMAGERPYHVALSPADAATELRRASGSQFDGRVVEALCAHLDLPETGPEFDAEALLAGRL